MSIERDIQLSLETQSMSKVMHFYLLQKTPVKAWNKAWEVTMDKSQQQMLLKPPQRIRSKKTAEATGYLAVNEIVKHVTKTVTNNNREYSKKNLQSHKYYNQRVYLRTFLYQRKAIANSW